MLGISYAAYYSSHQLAGWTWEYFTQARSALEEDRERQGELRKALDDLAHANRQLMLLNENLADLRLAAEQAERAKTAFLSRVSHEFRTPLNMIIGLTDLFFETPQVYGEALPQKLLEHMAIVHRNCQHLAALVDDVLDLSQVEAGRLALQKERFNLGEVVDKMTAIVRPLLEKKRIELLVEVENELPSIFGDRRRISQVVVNLLSNAARFTSQGEVRIRAMSQDGNVVVSVSDTGPGIAIEDKKAIFEPFCHGISGTRGEQGGSGLGLSISKQFVDLHGGKIWLESELGVGSTFYFSIPVDQPLRVTGSPGHWIIPEWVDRSSTTRLASVRLAERLVVLDEGEAIHPVLSRFSDEAEYVLTKSLEEAVAEVQRCPAHALLVNSPCPKALIGLLLEARQQLRELPLIGCSVRPSTERATVMGASGYLIKPVTRDKLQQAVRAIGTTVKRILIVDDGADDREVLSLQLRAIDDALEIETIASGEEALEVMRVRVPDLVLLDIIMPQMDGWQVLTLKQEDAAIRHIPVILVSAEDPQQRPITGELIVGTIGQGLSVNKLLDCSQALAALLKRPG
jgi:signal transduction histidine kinase/CheY-like chemotaxis protein